MQTNIVLTEQLLNAFKENEKLLGEIKKLQSELELIKQGRDLYFNENCKLRHFIKENGLDF